MGGYHLVPWSSVEGMSCCLVSGTKTRAQYRLCSACCPIVIPSLSTVPCDTKKAYRCQATCAVPQSWISCRCSSKDARCLCIHFGDNRGKQWEGYMKVGNSNIDEDERDRLISWLMIWQFGLLAYFHLYNMQQCK